MNPRSADFSSLMKSPLVRLVLAILATVSAPLAFAASAPEKVVPPPAASTSRTPPGEQLVITKGVFSRNGESVPATVRNLVDLVQQHYPDATITLVGVDDIVIENLTLPLRRVRKLDEPTSAKAQSVLSILTAFSWASGPKFIVQAFGENDFTLWTGAAPNRQLTEVFNLGILIKPNRGNLFTEDALRRLEAAGIGKEEAEVIKLTQSAAPPPSPEKLIAQIQDAVATTLGVSSRAPLPEFKYHAGTNLLIVVGTEPAIDAARKVIAALEKTPQ